MALLQNFLKGETKEKQREDTSRAGKVAFQLSYQLSYNSLQGTYSLSKISMSVYFILESSPHLILEIFQSL